MDAKYTLTTGPVNRSDLKSLLEKIDIFWFRLAYKIDQLVLSQNTRCKILATPVTGIDHIDEKLCAKLDINILCLRGEVEFLREVRATAEHTIFLTLALMRSGYSSMASVLKGKWNRDNFRGFEVYRKKVGIIGMGRLGRIVAEYFSALGCQILYYDTSDIAGFQSYQQAENLEILVKGADIISIHIPYNEQNHKILDCHFMSHFTASKWLINTSRGGVIDEEALLKVLEEGKIAGYATDVVCGEPDIADNKLIEYAREHDNVIITPHIGGNTYESFHKTERFIAEKINRWVENYVVD